MAERVGQHDLMQWLLEGRLPGWVVVDVRGRDFKGGHIPGALNVPYTQLWPEQLHASLTSRGLPKTVIFHCMYSQLRAPVCADLFIKYLRERSIPCSVAILEGGFSEWLRVCAKHPQRDSLIADFDPRQWHCIGGHWEHVTDCPWA